MQCVRKHQMIENKNPRRRKLAGILLFFLSIFLHSFRNLNSHQSRTSFDDFSR